MRGLLYYWWCVLVRAFWDTWTWLGHNLKKSVLGAITALAVPLVIAIIKSDTTALEKIEIWIIGVIVAVTIFIVVFVLFLLRTPKVLQDEAVAHAQDRIGELESAVVKLQGVQSAQADEIGSLKAAYAAKVCDLEKDVDYHRRSDPVRNALRHQVTEYLEQFQALETAILDGDKKAVGYVYEWEHTVAAYLSKHLSIYTKFRDNPPVGLSAPQKLISDEALSRCRTRIEQLQEVLEHIIK